ncbi:MAG: CBS domain-containing protein [Phycisphaerae bacterium]|nr:CBS domain-containing protein [Phycisphaerae bacterium]
MLCAKTIMKRDVLTVHPETPLDKAIDILIQYNITGMPVLNEDSSVAGIVTEKDILHFLLDKNILDIMNERLLCETTVHHIMTTHVVMFDEETPLTQICEALVDHNFRRVPIVDKDGKLIGIISRKDILAVIT